MSSRLVPTDGPLIDLDRARRVIRAAGLDGIVASSMRNVFYLSGHSYFDHLIEPESIAFAVLPADAGRPSHVTVSSSERYVEEDFPVWASSRVLYGSYYVKNGPPAGEHAPGAVEAAVAALHAAGLEHGRVGWELDLLPVNVRERIAAALPAMRMEDGTAAFKELRMLKTPREVARVRRATEITEEAIEEAFARIRVGVTEDQISRWIGEGIVQRGAEPLYVQVGTNGRGALGVSYPTARRVQAGDVIRTDVAAVYGHYTSDLGRCCVVGAPSSEQAAYYRVAYEALQAAMDAVGPGRTVREVFDAGVAVPRAAGYADFQRHHVGHGIGLQAHEWPFLKPSSAETIRPGMVLAIEVPYYVYGLGGFSPEDILVVTDRGAEPFSRAPSTLPVVGDV